MKKKIFSLMGFIIMVFILGACEQEGGDAEELRSIDVPIFEFAKDYLEWADELDFEIMLRFEDIDGNTVTEEDVLNNRLETVSIFPLQVNPENANLLIILESITKSNMVVNFRYRYFNEWDNRAEGVERLEGFLTTFDQYFKFDFSKISPDRSPSALVIWADTELKDFSFVETNFNDETVTYEVVQTYFRESVINEGQAFVILNWLNSGGTTFRDGMTFTDFTGIQRFFVFGADNKRGGITFYEISIVEDINVPDVSQQPATERPSQPTTTIPPAHNPNGFVASDINAQFRVTSETLNVRSERDSNSELVRTLRQGDIVHIRWILGYNDVNPIDTPWGAIDGTNNEFVNMNFLEPVSSPTPPLNNQSVLNIDHGANVEERFNRIYTFNGSVFGIDWINTDLIIWSNRVLRDFQVHIASPTETEIGLTLQNPFSIYKTHTIGDIALGEAVHVQTLTGYFAASPFSIISFINEDGMRDFFRVSDTFGPGADQVALIPISVEMKY